jgi:hypothetical protein
MAVTSSVARAAAALVAAPLLVLACGAPPDSGPTGTTEDSLCTQLQSGNGGLHMMSLCNPGTSSSGGGGGGGTTYSTSCGLIAGTFASSTYALPYNTQSPPSGLTGAGWASSSQADMDAKLANMNSICASPGGILCFFAMIAYEVIHEQWQFENNFADALTAVTGVDPTQAAPLLLASGDPNAAMHNWYGVEISAAQAYDPGVRAVINKFGVPPAQNEMNNYVVHPQIFQCTRTNNTTGASTTRYYGAWDPDCGSATCSPSLKPRVSGAT